MVFSDEDKILITKIYQLKVYNARQSRKEFADKGWTKSCINRLLKKFRDTGTADRRQGSGRPQSARTDENIDQVNDTVLSQEDQPRTHRTVREISRGTGIPNKSSVVRIIKMQLKCFKQWRRQRSTGARSFRGQRILQSGHLDALFSSKKVDELFLVVALALKTQAANTVSPPK